MQREVLSERLNGREYGEEITPAEEAMAKDNGLLVVFAYSDDNIEFRGIFHDERGVCDNSDVLLHREGFLDASHEDDGCPCEFCGYETVASRCLKITTRFSPDDTPDTTWVYKTDIPHSTFNVMEDGKVFCVGMVIDGKDLPRIKEIR